MPDQKPTPNPNPKDPIGPRDPQADPPQDPPEDQYELPEAFTKSPPTPAFRSHAPEMPEILRNAPPPRESKDKKKGLKLITQPSGQEMRAIGIGLEFTAMVAAGVLLGWGADYLLGTSHWLIVGLVVGLLTGGWQLFKGASRLNRDLDRASGRTKRPSTPRDEGQKPR